MSEAFDPYLKWLGIREADRPPNHYQLLGLEAFEGDLEVISNAADRQMSHVRTFQAGRHSAISQRILNELAAARVTLLNADKKSIYDAQLRAAARVPTTSRLARGRAFARGCRVTGSGRRFRSTRRSLNCRVRSTLLDSRTLRVSDPGCGTSASRSKLCP